MAIKHDHAIREAVEVTRTKVWMLHWQEGETALRASQVVAYIRDIRTTAQCTEGRLPESLRTVLDKARALQEEKGQMSLHDFLVPLNGLVLPAAADAE